MVVTCRNRDDYGSFLCFGSRESEVQILSPRPVISRGYDCFRSPFLLIESPGTNCTRIEFIIKPQWDRMPTLAQAPSYARF
jgi:hypothetical protein